MYTPYNSSVVAAMARSPPTPNPPVRYAWNGGCPESLTVKRALIAVEQSALPSASDVVANVGPNETKLIRPGTRVRQAIVDPSARNIPQMTLKPKINQAYATFIDYRGSQQRNEESQSVNDMIVMQQNGQMDFAKPLKDLRIPAIVGSTLDLWNAASSAISITDALL